MEIDQLQEDERERLARFRYSWSQNEQLPELMELASKAPNLDPFKPTRIQGDGLGDVVSELTATTPEGESITRKELGADTDINVMLAKYGIMQQQRPDPRFIEIDYGIDLQAAYAAVEQSKRAIEGVPDELREKYPNSFQLLNAVESGEYEKDLRDLQNRKDAERVAAEKDARERAAATAAPEVTPKP